MNFVIALCSLFLGIIPLKAQVSVQDSFKEVLSLTMDPMQQFDILNRMNEDYFNSGSGSIDSNACQRMLQIAHNTRNDSLLAISYNWIGNYFYWKSDHNTALEYFIKGVPIAEKVGDKRRICSYYIDMSRIYNNVGNTNQQVISLNQARESLPEVNADKYYLLLAQIQVELSIHFLVKGQLDSVEYYVQGVQESALKLNSNVFYTVSHNLFGMFYEAKSNFSLAENHFTQAIMLSDSVHYFWGLQFSLNNYTEFLMNRKRSNQAKNSAYLALNLSEKTNDLRQTLRSAVVLSKIFTDIDKLDSALYFSKLELKLRDSIFNKDKLNKIQTMAFSEQLRGKELALKKEELRENRIRNIQVGSIAIGLIILIVAFFILSSTVFVNEKVLSFFSIIGLLITFEFISLLLDPYISQWANNRPIYLLLCNVLIAAIIAPIHNLLHQEASKLLIEKNKMAKAKAGKIIDN